MRAMVSSVLQLNLDPNLKIIEWKIRILRRNSATTKGLVATARGEEVGKGATQIR